MDHRKISNESWAPAHTSSPLMSTASEENCFGRGEVRVLKLRYLKRDKKVGLPDWYALVKFTLDLQTKTIERTRCVCVCGAKCMTKFFRLWRGHNINIPHCWHGLWTLQWAWKWFHCIFCYLCRSKARTVPSREALTTTKPLVVKVTLVMLLVCSVNVTKHRPLVVFHTFTWKWWNVRQNTWVTHFTSPLRKINLPCHHLLRWPDTGRQESTPERPCCWSGLAAWTHRIHSATPKPAAVQDL